MYPVNKQQAKRAKTQGIGEERLVLRMLLLLLC
jgi:hypothetical protein